MKMKKMVLNSTLAVFLTVAGLPPKKAEAGIVFVAAEFAFDNGLGIPGIMLVYGGVISSLVGGILGPATALKYGLAALVLDADGSLPQDGLEKELIGRYPFIDNENVITNLSLKVKQKFNEAPKSNDSIMVKLNETEVRSLLNPADLTEEEILTVAHDLK